MKITEEQRKRWTTNMENWMEEAKGVSDPEELQIFADKLIGHCADETEADFYEDSANSTAALAYAAIEMMAQQYGLTGFQIGCIMWRLIDKMVIEDHDVGMKLTNYNNMLFPQYEYRFEKTISKEHWEAMQKKAKKLIEEDEKNPYFRASEDVRKHWENIVAGEIPFGYTVEEEKR